MAPPVASPAPTTRATLPPPCSKSVLAALAARAPARAPSSRAQHAGLSRKLVANVGGRKAHRFESGLGAEGAPWRPRQPRRASGGAAGAARALAHFRLEQVTVGSGPGGKLARGTVLQHAVRHRRRGCGPGGCTVVRRWAMATTARPCISRARASRTLPPPHLLIQLEVASSRSNRRVLEEGARERDALALSARQTRAAITDHWCRAPAAGRRGPSRSAAAAARPDLFIAGLRARIANVFDQ